VNAYKRISALGAAIALPALSFAQSAEPAIDKGDSTWMIVSTALVLLMTPALALFYGGMVQKKNVLNTMLLSFVMMGVSSISWAMLGYSLAFGESTTGFIGSIQYLWGQNISLDTPLGEQTIPAALFMLFQMKFAIITPALISGAVAERIKFSGYLVFTLLWSLLIYAPLACWTWNSNGWLMNLGALDFAGGTVVHLASGVSAIALVMILGPRKGKSLPPNNITLTLLGAGLLWFGWFGFNAGSALAMDSIAVNAFLTTHLAAAAGLISWMSVEWIKQKKITAIGAASGLVAGLVGITPAAGFVGVGGALAIGLLAGGVCCLAVDLKHKLGYDDALDVVAVHGVGGLLGSILTGVFASPAVNSAAAGALENGRMQLVLVQLAAAGATIAFAFCGTWLSAGRGFWRKRSTKS
jgi:Amt family ammonium transporter